MNAYVKLCKLKLSLFAAFSAATGFMLAASGLDAKILMPAAGVFLLACGSCALNQYQERNIDALMPRTSARPIPRGRVRPAASVVFSAGLIFAGALALLAISPAAAVLGLSAVIWYNGFYTYFKRKSAFAAVPGALVGALPPAVGWVSAGGPFPDRRILAVCFVFFMWQVPHFWILLLRYRDEYEEAGFPSLTQKLGARRVSRMVFFWILATAASCVLMPLYGIMHPGILLFLQTACAAWIVWSSAALLEKNAGRSIFRSLFNKLNIYMVATMLLLCAASLA